MKQCLSKKAALKSNIGNFYYFLFKVRIRSWHQSAGKSKKLNRVRISQLVSKALSEAIETRVFVFSLVQEIFGLTLLPTV